MAKVRLFFSAFCLTMRDAFVLMDHPGHLDQKECFKFVKGKFALFFFSFFRLRPLNPTVTSSFARYAIQQK